jgi:hypothetical protein
MPVGAGELGVESDLALVERVVVIGLELDAQLHQFVGPGFA